MGIDIEDAVDRGRTTMSNVPSRYLVAAVAIGLTVVFVPSDAWSWDGQSDGPAFGLVPADTVDGRLVPKEKSPVALRTKRVRITRTSGDDEESHFFFPGKWVIDAHYRLANPTSDTQTVVAAVPEWRGRYRGRYDESPTGRRAEGYFDLQIEVDGVSISVDRREIDDVDGWLDGTTYLHVLQTDIPARTNVDVRVRYEREDMFDGGHLFFSYDGRPEQRWRGPIELIRYDFRLRTRPWGFYFRSDPTELDQIRTPELVDYREWHDGNRPTTRIRLEARDREPTAKLHTIFWVRDGLYGRPTVLTALADDLSCPKYDEGTDFAQETDESERTETLRDTLDDMVSSADAGDTPDADTLEAQLRRCRNVPYARHGYDFEDSSLDAYFYGDRLPTQPQSPETSGAWDTLLGPRLGGPRHPDEAIDEYRYVASRKNPDYSPRLLTERDRNYVQLLKALEAHLADHRDQFE